MLVSDLSPKEVFSYFKEISDIPRGSGNTDRIAQYCVDFANSHNLLVRRDEADNVVIFKDGSKGYEDKEPLILQGHIDMVCEKSADCHKNMELESIDLCTDGERVWADGTTLGGDDGIAVAYILAILASDTIEHPPIQAVLTSDEEIGMLGAQALDTSDITARRLINIESETEGVLFVSCAGGVRAQCEIELGSREASSKNVHTVYEITVGGLQGGHSGVEIHKQHANAIKVLGSLLTGIQRECDICVSDIIGGGKENAIPKEATAFIAINSDESPAFVKKFREYTAILQQEYKAVEPDIAICLEKKDIAADIYSLEASKNIIYVLGQAIDGVCRMSTQIQGMVETSLNLGTVFIKDDKLVYRYLIRSNTASGKRLVLDKVSAFAEFAGGKAVTTSDYPAWEYSSDSRLRNVMIESFKSVYGREAEVTSIHAGLECGILSGKMPGVDMISFGPTLVDVHTPDEYMDVASVKRSWNYLLEVLRNI